jgi:hypothetical protein
VQRFVDDNFVEVGTRPSLWGYVLCSISLCIKLQPWHALL